MTWTYRVRWFSRVEKQIQKMPLHIGSKLREWAKLVEEFGLAEVRKRSGFHDEPLMGSRAGQRSFRLNRAYRAIYVESREGLLQVVEVIEVSKHEY